MAGRWKTESGTLDTMCSASPFTLLIASPMVNKPPSPQQPSRARGRAGSGVQGAARRREPAREQRSPPARGAAWGTRPSPLSCCDAASTEGTELHKAVHQFQQMGKVWKWEHLPPKITARILRHL